MPAANRNFSHVRIHVRPDGERFPTVFEAGGVPAHYPTCLMLNLRTRNVASSTMETAARDLLHLDQILSASKSRMRINVTKQNRPLSGREVDAIARAFRAAVTPRDVIVTSILALLCCVPARISEVLALPTDCEVMPFPGDGIRAGLRWRPAKGGTPQVKFVPEAMLPVAQEALRRIREQTEPVREAARQAMAGDTSVSVPKDFPVFDSSSGLTYDDALCVVFPNQLGGARPIDRTSIQRLGHVSIDNALESSPWSGSIFETTGVVGANDKPVVVTTHMARHYLNAIANQSNVPQADIALWSGRRSLAQNSSYDHETAADLVKRIKKRRGASKLPTIPIDDREAFDISLVKQAAHTTQFGWCNQSLRQHPCQMFGKCLSCQHLICIKGATGKLENIKSELARERALHRKALAKKEQGFPVNARWIEVYERKILRLEQLVTVLEDESLPDGAPIYLSDSAPDSLPQFEIVAAGIQRENLIASSANATPRINEDV